MACSVQTGPRELHMAEPNTKPHQSVNPCKHRVFIGPVNVASYYSGLQKGLRELGVDAELVLFTKHRYLRAAQNSTPPLAVRFVDWCVDCTCLSNATSTFTRTMAKLLLPFARLLVFLWSLVYCDVFVFAAAKGFYSLYELPLLKLLNKRLIFVFNGSESRPAYMGGLPSNSLTDKQLRKLQRRSRRQQLRLQWIERYADVCINHAPHGYFHKRPYIDHCIIGHPIALTGDVPTGGTDFGGSKTPVRIVHAPSVCGPKGTEKIRTMIQELKEEGLSIDYVELTGRPNSEVLTELQQCDFVVDELYSDISLAGLGTEAAFFGKPAVVGGYAQDTLRSLVGGSKLPLATYVRPEHTKDTIRRLIVDDQFRDDCGNIASRFVRENWAPVKMAARFLRIIDGNIPDEWWVRPTDLQYLHGFGATEENRRQVLRQLIMKHGKQGLLLTDKPGLEQALVDFADAAEIPASPTQAAA